MAKKIKFALKMKDGVEVRTLQELKDGFDLNAVMAYFLDGKLEVWLSDRYYDDLADSIEELDKGDPELGKKLCGIFGVEYEDDTMSIEEIEERNRRISRLLEITDDESIIEHVDSVAFSQEELADLLDEDIKTIYLCDNNFRIPTKVSEVVYINVNSSIEMNAALFEKYKKNNIVLIGFKEMESFCDMPKDIQKSDTQSENLGKLEMNSDYDIIYEGETMVIDKLITILNKRVKYCNCNIKVDGYLEEYVVAENSKLYFEKCKIEFSNDDDDYCFITSKNSDIEFLNSEIVGGTRFIRACFYIRSVMLKEMNFPIDNKICFKDCRVKDVQHHFIDESSGRFDFLEISKSYFCASANNDEEDYFSSGREKVMISDSEFNGFDGKIVSDSQLIRILNTKFYNCKNFIGYLSGDNKIEVLNCEFRDCLHIIDTSMTLKVKIQNSDFTNCFGKFKCGEDSEIKNCRFNASMCEFQFERRTKIEDCSFMDYEIDEDFLEENELGSDALMRCGEDTQLIRCKFENLDIHTVYYLIAGLRVSDTIYLKECKVENCETDSELLQTSFKCYGTGLFSKAKECSTYFEIKKCIGLEDYED